MNNIIKIEKNFKLMDNVKLSMLSFLTVGSLLCLGISISPFVLPVAGIGLFEELQYRNAIRREKYLMGNHFRRGLLVGGELNNDLYKDLLGKWIDKYLDDSKSLVEKKYRLIFLSFWLDQHNVPFNINKCKNKIAENAYELMHKGETKFDLVMLYTMHTSNEVNQTNMFMKLLGEDLEKDEGRMDIIRKVYEDFRHMAFLGKNIGSISEDKYKFIMNIQDFRFTDADYDVIKSDMEAKEKESKIQLKLYSGSKQPLSAMIEKEDDLIKLDILKKFFEKKKEEKTSVFEYDPLPDIEAKKQYIFFNGEKKFEVKTDVKSSRLRI